MDKPELAFIAKLAFPPTLFGLIKVVFSDVIGINQSYTVFHRKNGITCTWENVHIPLTTRTEMLVNHSMGVHCRYALFIYKYCETFDGSWCADINSYIQKTNPFEWNIAWSFMRIMILMKYHSLFLSKIRKDVTKFVVCCSCDWRFKSWDWEIRKWSQFYT